MGDSHSTSVRPETCGKLPEKTDSLRLTPAHRDVLLGLYEGRTIVVDRKDCARWADTNTEIGPELDDLTEEYLVAASVRFRFRFWRSRPDIDFYLTPSGRALAERLAKEGR